MVLAPCVTSPHPEANLPGAKQLRLCLLSKSGLGYSNKSQKPRTSPPQLDRGKTAMMTEPFARPFSFVEGRPPRKCTSWRPPRGERLSERARCYGLLMCLLFNTSLRNKEIVTSQKMRQRKGDPNAQTTRGARGCLAPKNDSAKAHGANCTTRHTAFPSVAPQPPGFDFCLSTSTKFMRGCLASYQRCPAGWGTQRRDWHKHRRRREKARAVGLGPSRNAL